MGQDDLGRHYYETGDLHEASKAYSKEREYCQMPSHLAIMQQRLIMVALEQRAWPNALANIMKLNGINQQPRDKEKIQPKLDAALGICHLQTKRYKDAANTFLQISPRLISAKSKSPTADELYNEVITPNDIAIYGGLCALASMDRDELRHSVLESSSFRDYLELEPQIRRAISSFVAGKYSVCLGILDSYKTDYLLDIHLHRHVQELFSSIQSKAILQYFIPFSCVTIKALAEAFNSDEDRLENDLVGLIKLGILDARIDLERRVLLANRVDPRLKVHEEAMEMAKEYEKAAKLQIIRLELLNAGLEVSKSKQRDQPQGLKSARG
jgi:COP9 signalosome complex subunit 1